MKSYRQKEPQRNHQDEVVIATGVRLDYLAAKWKIKRAAGESDDVLRNKVLVAWMNENTNMAIMDLLRDCSKTAQN